MSRIREYLGRLFRVHQKNHQEVCRTVSPDHDERCTGCFQKVDASEILVADCGHKYCCFCLRSMASIALDSLAQIPAKCCSEPLPLSLIVSVMDPRDKKRYIAMWEEQEIPPADRWYCPRTTCGRWIHPKYLGQERRYQVCPYCSAKICLTCRDFTHGGMQCSIDEGLKAILELAKKNEWQRCYYCHALVEKLVGCKHITCRCGREFCYKCGGKWRRGDCRCWGGDVSDLRDELITDGDLDPATLLIAMEQTCVEQE